MLCRSVLKGVILVVLTWTLACSNPASATVFLPGQEITYGQSEWGSISGTAQNLLVNDYNVVYASTGGIFIIGETSTYYALFDSGPALHAYLPQTGTIGVLSSIYVDPIITTSGPFGGDVAALKLNIDFSDAGITLGSSGIPIGNLLLTALMGTSALLDGLTVRQYLGDANTCLGGGACVLGVSDMDLIAFSLNASFDSGVPDQFAQDHLAAPTVSRVPEPSTLLLFASSLVVLGSMRRFRPQ
jgi:hypothetical protein